MGKKKGCPAGWALKNNKCVPVTKSAKIDKIVFKKHVDWQKDRHGGYREPFAGGGSVFFRKENTNMNVLNDKNRHLINYYKEIKKTSSKKIKGCKNPTRKQWKNVKNKFDKNKDMNACEFHQLINGSYGGKAETWGHHKRKDGTIISVNVMKNLAHYQNKLNKTRILNQDYRTVTNNYDSKNTLFYVDPPYVDAVKYHMPPVDPNDVAKTYKNIKGRVIISYNDHPSVRSAFSKKDGWKIKKLDIPYTLQKNDLDNYNQPHKELLITNF